MKRLAAVAAALMMAAACGSDNTPPTNPTDNTGPITFTAQLSAANEVPAITGCGSQRTRHGHDHDERDARCRVREHHGWRDG